MKAEDFEHALALHKAGRLEDAARAYDAVLLRNPALAPAHLMKGVLALQRGQPHEALVHLDHALAIDNAHPGIHLNRGNALRALGRLDEAEAAYRQALTLDPGMLFAHNNLGNVLRDRGAFGDALAAYERALALDGSFFAAAANRAQTLAALRAERSVQIAAYEQALALADTQPIAGPTIADCHNALANLYATQGRDDDALAHYDRAVALDPGFVEAHVNRASALARAARHEDAVAAFRRALELHPASKPAHKGLTLNLRRLGRNNEAAEAYRAWSLVDPDDPVPTHMAIALAGGAPPERASDDYLRTEFDGFAETFDRVLSQLNYRAPRLVEEATRRHRAGTRPPGWVLDAGCGTGLCAQFLRPLSRSLTGVDLSPAMLAQARQRALYDELIESELGAYLSSQAARFDLIVAADVLVYFGRLDGIVTALGAALVEGGLLVFTIEAGHEAERGYALNPGGRYTHERGYVERVLATAGLRAGEITAATLRSERGSDVSGWVVVASREAGQMT